MKARIRRDPTRSLHEVYDEVASELPDDANVPQFASIRSLLYRCRATQIPRIPANIGDVVIEGVWAETRGGRRFLRRLDNDWGIAVFASDHCISQLGQCTYIFMDATFKSCPRPYSQFFTIHGLYVDRVIPMAFVLMHQRQVGAYRQVLGCIKNRCAHLTGHPMQPDLIVETEFPAAEVRACFFHYCQAIWKRARQQRLCGPGAARLLETSWEIPS